MSSFWHGTWTSINGLKNKRTITTTTKTQLSPQPPTNRKWVGAQDRSRHRVLDLRSSNAGDDFSFHGSTVIAL